MDIWINIWRLKWLFALGIVFIYWNLSNNKNKDFLSLIMGLLIIVYVFYYYNFRNTFYLASFIVFIPILIYVFNYLIRRNSVYVLETRLKNDGFNISNGGRLMLIDKAKMDKCKHLGDTRPNMWELDGMFFCNLYDEENNVMFHSELAETKNLTFFANQLLFIACVRKLPKALQENCILKSQALIIASEIAEKIEEESILSFPLVNDYLRKLNKNTIEQEKEIEEIEKYVVGHIASEAYNIEEGLINE